MSAGPRILYVINSFDRGGAEAGLLTLVRGGLFTGCELKIAALVRGKGRLEDRLAALGVEPEILLDRPQMRTADMLGLLTRLYRLIRRFRPRIVIASLPQANLLARLCVLFDRHITFISFEHNSHLAKRAYEVMYRLTSRRVDWMFADAPATLLAAKRRLYRKAPSKQTVVPLVMFDSPSKTAGAGDDGPFHLVNAGRFTTVKNQAALIEAVALLRSQGQDVKLTLYGDGSEQAACKDLAQRLGVSAWVHFAGFVADWATRPADLFVVASKYEGQCLVVLEAMHAGIPVAAPLIGGLLDLADEQVFHPLKSVQPAALAAGVAQLRGAAVYSQELAKRAANLLDERFGVQNVCKHYERIRQSFGAIATGEFAAPRTAADEARRLA